MHLRGSTGKLVSTIIVKNLFLGLIIIFFMKYRSLLIYYHKLTLRLKESMQLIFLYLYLFFISQILKKTQILELKFQIYI
jgi:hypothetical protein